MPDLRARELRRYMTPAERRLWSALRDRRASGFKFRRQRKIGPFYVDFVCLETRTIIEVDGGHHDDEEQAWYDFRRSGWLKEKGFRILRFRNSDVLRNSNQVIGAIEQELAKSAPHPSRRSRADPPSP